MFRYSPLLPANENGSPSIRILHIQPHQSNTDSIIECSLVDAYLGEGDSYEALSYCWGDSRNTMPILLNRVDFPVRGNLLDALRRLRRENSLRRMWIDAICVNQEDIEERNNQVQLMGRIYTSTSRCLAWLGCDTVTAETGLTTHRKIEELRLSNPYDQNDQQTLETIVSRWLDSGLPEPDSEGWVALQAILLAPWCTRAWVVQEVAFPRLVTLICGDVLLDWDDTARTLDFAVRNSMLDIFMPTSSRPAYEAISRLG